MYAPPAAPPSTVPQPAAPPTAPSVRPASRTFALVFAIVAIVATAGAIALAAFGGQQSGTAQDTAPSGWSQVYDAGLAAADPNWETSQGCQFSHGGLYAASNATCQFTPSTTQDLTSQGFLLRLSVAPGADVPDELAPAVVLGNDIYIGVTQMGQYSICEPTACDPTAQAGIHQVGTTSDWHSDPFVANTMAVKYDAQAGQLTLYLNGSQVVSAGVSIAPTTTIALAAPSGAEAVFTHATLYSASANGLGG